MIVDRNDFIVKKCKDKSVFDIACVCHNLSGDQIKKGIWLHHNILAVSRLLIGCDIENEEIKKLRGLGYNIIYSDAEKIPYVADIEVIVMGGCIEHFFNPGLVLDRVMALCNADTEVIISTVNAWAIRYWISALFGREERTCRPDHVSWYSHYVLENLLRMKGFQVIEKHYYNNYPKRINGIRPFFRKLQKLLMPFTSHGLICVFKLKNST